MPKKLLPPVNPANLPADSVERRIHLIRRQKVMIDADLAELYQVLTKNLNLAVRRNLDRLAWKPLAMGDLGARIHVLGNIDVTLVYQLGDEEMGPAADLLFDACFKRPFAAEEAAAIATRICHGIM